MSWFQTLLIACVIVGPFRSAVADWNDVPTGSMEPTILPGDRILVDKLAYGLRLPFTHEWLARWGDPKPGDVVILFSPEDGTRLVKRIVAGPGDTVALQNNTLLINGIASGYSPLSGAELAELDPVIRGRAVVSEENLAGHEHAVMAMPGLPAMRTFGPVRVPEGEFFVMGDNRDNSADSRYFGFVPRGEIVGRARAVVLSVDPERSFRPRWERFFSALR